METYTTRITIGRTKRDGSNPIEADVRCDRDCATVVNGRYRFFAAGVDKRIAVPPTGVITIVAQTSSLESPIYSVKVGRVRTPANPMQGVRDKLSAYSTLDALHNAQRSDGSPLSDWQGVSDAGR